MALPFLLKISHQIQQLDTHRIILTSHRDIPCFASDWGTYFVVNGVWKQVCAHRIHQAHHGV